MYKNVIVYQIDPKAVPSAETMQVALERFAYEPAAPAEAQRVGWVCPVHEGQLVYEGAGFLALTLHEESKVLPPSVIRDTLDERAAEIEEREHRRLRRRERQQLQEEIILDLLPQAFSRHRRTRGYIDTVSGLVVVDASSNRAAEDFCEYLREAIGSLPVRLIETRELPSAVFTRWLVEGDIPSNVSLGEGAVLVDPQSEGSEIRIKRLDLTSEEVIAHLKAGQRVQRLEVEWAERWRCSITAELQFKGMKALDLVREDQGELEDESFAARFDADMSIFVLEFRKLLADVLDWFGGDAAERGRDAA